MSLCGLNRLDVSANLCAMCMLCIPSATIACELRAISSLCSSTGTREHKHVRGASSGFRYNIPHRRVGSEIVCEQGLSIPTRGSCQPRASTTVAEEPCASVHTSGINATRAMPSCVVQGVKVPGPDAILMSNTLDYFAERNGNQMRRVECL